jgi:hypothetical protein
VELQVFGSSQIWVKRGFDFEDEVVIVSEAVGLALDHLDHVVHAFELTGVERELAVRDDPWVVASQVAGEGLKRRDTTRFVARSRSGVRAADFAGPY